MPSTYAHYRLGNEVRRSLEGKERRIIEKWPQLYLIGLHGPDILFYYRPLKANPVSDAGGRLHEESGRRFFRRALRLAGESPEPEAALAYVYGMLVHFALDVSCHGFVSEWEKISGVSHAGIEAEFDRRLLLKDGRDPVRQVLTRHIQPTRQNARLIAPFYPGVSQKQIQKALRGMIWESRVLRCPTKAKRLLLDCAFRLMGKEELSDMVIRPRGNPACRESSRRLFRLYGAAKQRGVEFIRGAGQVQTGETAFPAIFSFNFDGVKAEDGEETGWKDC